MTPKALLTTIAVGVALLVVPSTASAASSVYAPDQDARNFADNVGGWIAETDSDGACVEVVLCPQITNTYEPSGGEDRDGFIRTAIGSLTGVGGTAIGTWTSPSFVYRGVDGDVPDSIGFTLAHRADVGQLLSVAGNSATFQVELVGVSNKADSVTVVESRSLAGIDDWSRIREVGVEPSQLKIGERYQLAITTSYRTGATVVPGGSADYDDVVLKAKTDSSGDGTGGAGGGGGNGDNGGSGNGGNGDNGGGGAGGNGSDTGGAGGAAGGSGSGSDTGALAGSGVAGKTATLTDQGKLRVKVRCGRKAGAKCKMRIAGLVSKRGAKVGKAKKVKVAKGRSRVISLHVKPALRDQLASNKRIFVRQHVKAGKHSATKVVRLKLVHS